MRFVGLSVFDVIGGPRERPERVQNLRRRDLRGGYNEVEVTCCVWSLSVTTAGSFFSRNRLLLRCW